MLIRGHRIFAAASFDEKTGMNTGKPSRQSLPRNTVDLFHDFADLVHHMLAGLALRCKLHETDLILLLAEIDLPFVFFGSSQTDPSAVEAALEII